MSTATEVFNNPPIREAVIDIRATAPAEHDFEYLMKIVNKMKDRYPTHKKRRSWEGHLKFNEEKIIHSEVDRGFDGLIFHSEDGAFVAQCRLDGFTMSRLAPYKTWDSFRDEAKRCWEIYQNHIQPTAANRLAVKFINSIEIPLPVASISDFFQVAPQVPNTVGRELASFFMQVVVPDRQQGFETIYTFVNEGSKDSVKAAFILDIDVVQPIRDLKPDAQLWVIIEKLHSRVEEFFFSSITEKTKTLFR